MALNARSVAQKVYPIALATAGASYIYLWLTKPTRKDLKKKV